MMKYMSGSAKEKIVPMTIVLHSMQMRYGRMSSPGHAYSSFICCCVFARRAQKRELFVAESATVDNKRAKRVACE